MRNARIKYFKEHPEARRKLSELYKGCKHSEESKIKMSKKQLELRNNDSFRKKMFIIH